MSMMPCCRYGVTSAAWRFFRETLASTRWPVMAASKRSGSGWTPNRTLSTPRLQCSAASTAAGPQCSRCTIFNTSITRNSSAGRDAVLAGMSPTDLSARHASYFQANSDYTREDLLNHFPWLSPEQMEVIPSGSTDRKFAPPAATNSMLASARRSSRAIPVFPGATVPHKNHLTVLKALEADRGRAGRADPAGSHRREVLPLRRYSNSSPRRSMSYVRHLGKVPFERHGSAVSEGRLYDHGHPARIEQLADLGGCSGGHARDRFEDPADRGVGAGAAVEFVQSARRGWAGAAAFSPSGTTPRPASAQAAHNRQHIGCLFLGKTPPGNMYTCSSGSPTHESTGMSDTARFCLGLPVKLSESVDLHSCCFSLLQAWKYECAEFWPGPLDGLGESWTGSGSY